MFHFLLSLLIIIIISQLFGALAKVIGQPKVVGEMIGGILVGPSFLGASFPGIQEWLFNADIKEQLYLLSQLGISLYMFLIGIHVRKEKIENKLVKKCYTTCISRDHSYFYYDICTLIGIFILL